MNNLQTLIEEREKEFDEACDKMTDEGGLQKDDWSSELSVTAVKDFLRKSMEMAYIKGAENYSEYLKNHTKDHDVLEKTIRWMPQRLDVQLSLFKQQLQSPEPEGEKEREDE